MTRSERASGPSGRLAAVAVMAAGAALNGCSSGGTPKTAAASTTISAAPTVPPASLPTLPQVTSTSTPAASGAAQNLAVTNDVRAQLVQTVAAGNNLPASAYTGLQPGRTYYAFDPQTATFWAGAALVPSSSSVPAQVSVQDDGSYFLFHHSTGQGWTAQAVGVAGIAGTKCPTTVPASVLALWHWAPGTCRAPN
ncbi:MAG: hypothetical protein M3N98_16045 [Actinomycetota bacterium]|nr:hypothetical protein [Actinomycetota bacterium]